MRILNSPCAGFIWREHHDVPAPFIADDLVPDEFELASLRFRILSKMSGRKIGCDPLAHNEIAKAL